MATAAAMAAAAAAGPVSTLARLVRAGKWKADAAQQRAALKLQQLHDGIGRTSPPAGVYLHGPVGSGKTALMDLLLHCASERPEPAVTRRLHFHELVATVHRGLHSGHAPADVGKRLGADTDLLAIDEFELTDIADAAIVTQVLRGVLETECAFVTTSNRAPAELYPGGLNRHVYIPALVKLFEERSVDVHALAPDAPIDYRSLHAAAGSASSAVSSATGVVSSASGAAEAERRLGHEAERRLERMRFFQHGSTASESVGTSTALDAALDAAVQRMGGGGTPQERVVRLGHTRSVHLGHVVGGAARVRFDELCGRPFGASDYLRLASELHTLALTHVPRLSTDATRDEARRFIVLLDVWYEAGHTPLLSSCADCH